jgi:ADP-heptose:LPS heptosyltransferase
MTTNTEWYGRSTRERTIFDPDFRVKRGEIRIIRELDQWARDRMPLDYVMVAPRVKGTYSADNKDWGWEKWAELARRSSYPLLHCDDGSRPFLGGAASLITPTFDHAVAVLSLCRGIVTTEGGLHHAAGALRKPAVVIFGAFNRPENLGYRKHVNLAEPDPECLGQRKSNPACRAAMERITVDRVLEAMSRAFD